MLRNVLCVVLALVICLTFSGLVKADEGTVVDVKDGKVTLKVGGKDASADLKSVKVLDAAGKELKGDAAAAALKKDTKVDVKMDAGKVTEIHIK
jgi:sarcosine oxidase gamma subunit